MQNVCMRALRNLELDWVDHFGHRQFVVRGEQIRDPVMNFGDTQLRYDGLGMALAGLSLRCLPQYAPMDERYAP